MNIQLKKYTRLTVKITMMAVSLFCLFSVSCINKQKREYRHMCDSLSKMDFPPRVLDTLFFRKYGNGIEVDTTFPNGEQHLIQLDYANNYYYAIEYPNIPIIDVMSYDGKDGKLIDWHQRFIDWNNISPWVWYDKEGNVCELSATCSEEKDYIYPTYSIHQLIEKLKQENIDLFHNTSIYYGTDYRDADSIPYKKCGWHVMMKDTTVSNDTCNMTVRLYDSKTGILDEAKMKEFTRKSVRKMLHNENLEHAVWSASFHYNTDNIHIHVAVVEPIPMREQRSYTVYDYVPDAEGDYIKSIYGPYLKATSRNLKYYTKDNARYRREEHLDANGKPVKINGYVGPYKQSSIEFCKSTFVNEVLNEKEYGIKINSMIRDSIVRRKSE